MRIWIHRSIGALLVTALLLNGSVAFATEPVETEPAETVATEETVPPETEQPAETPTESPAEPAPTEAPEQPEYYPVDTKSEIYALCDALAEGMSFDQLMVYDATNDRMLYTNTREGDKLYPASITKLFSSYVALQYLKPSDILTTGDELKLVQPGSSKAYIGRGQQLYVKTVVEGMMLPSGNDAAMVLAAAAGWKIAEDRSLSPEEAVQVFVQEMNRMAREVGFERTHFSNPDGWHTGSHYTCLNDMARIAKLALENDTISRYMRMGKDEEVVFVSGHTATWENTNSLVSGKDGFYRRDAIGMKTGYTRQAENCLMSAFRCSDGRNLVIGVFGYADSNQRFRDVIALADACKAQLK